MSRRKSSLTNQSTTWWMTAIETTLENTKQKKTCSIRTNILVKEKENKLFIIASRSVACAGCWTRMKTNESPNCSFDFFFQMKKKERVYNKAQLIDIIYKESSSSYVYVLDDQTEKNGGGGQFLREREKKVRQNILTHWSSKRGVDDGLNHENLQPIYFNRFRWVSTAVTHK